MWDGAVKVRAVPSVVSSNEEIGKTRVGLRCSDHDESSGPGLG